jgi:hypothetical protein
MTGVAFAQDSASITVTCSIPEIPGVNSPLIQEKTSAMQSPAMQPAIKEKDTKNPHETNAAPKETTSTQIVLAQNYASAADVLETYYSR